MSAELKKLTKGKVAVFIDAANLEHSAKDLRIHIRYKKLFKLFKSNCNLYSISFYTVAFGTKSHNNFLTLLKKSGFRLITKPLKVIKRSKKDGGHLRKANFDVEIAVDAMRLKNEYKTMVLFSGDSDFDYLVKILRREGKSVIVISTKHHISKELITSADRYIDLKKLKQELI